MASQTEPIPELPPYLKSKGISLIEKVGGGAFATVYKASWTQLPNTVIAAKVIPVTDETKTVWIQKCLKNERHTWMTGTQTAESARSSN